MKPPEYPYEADIIRAIEKASDWVEQVKIREVPIVCEGLGIEEEQI